MKKKLKKHHSERHKKASTEKQFSQSETTYIGEGMEPDTSMIQEEIEHIATDTYSQQSFFEPVEVGIGLKPWLRPRFDHVLRDALRKHGRRRHGPRIHWKAVKYDEGHLHPDLIIRKRDIVPPDRE